MQGIEQMVVTERRFHDRQQTLLEMIRPTARLGRVEQNNRQILIPLVELPQQRGQALFQLAATENHALDFVRRLDLLGHNLQPTGAVGNDRIFPEKLQNDTQIVTTLSRIINQQDMTVWQHRRGAIPVSRRERLATP